MTTNALNKIKNIQAKLTANNLAAVAYPYFVKVTPIDTGNARSHTSLVGNEIRAQYPYAKRLDRGWSRQSPNGMSEPTIDYIKRYIKAQLGK